MRWLRINTFFFSAAFFVALLLVLLFPYTMFGIVRSWGASSRYIASTLLGEASSKHFLFVKVLTWNCLVTVLFFIVSLFFLAPLVAVMMGTFYSLGLMSAIDHFLRGEIWYPLWSSPVLISIEASFILLTITFASSLATEIFGVKPERKDVVVFWRKNWKKLLPEQKRAWKDVFEENKKDFILFILVLLALLLFGAWFEAII